MDLLNKAEVDVQHSDVSYERRDLSYRAVFVFLAVLGTSALFIHLLIFGLFRSFGRSQFVPYQSTNPIMTSREQLREIGGDPAASLPMPRLQPNPVADLNKFRLLEEEQLDSYGWVDPQAGKIHIPIERAIDILGSSWPQQSNRNLQNESAANSAGASKSIRQGNGPGGRP